MALVSELQFAQRYPFSGQAKKVLAENNLSLEEIPEELFSRAELMVIAAAKNRDYYLGEKLSNSTGLLLQEILAFPIAKIIVSLQKDSFLNEKFAMLFSKSFLKYLDLEKNKKETALEIAGQLGIKFDFAQEKFFVSLALSDFLKIPFKHSSLKLVNQHVSKGKVFLPEAQFYFFLSEKVFYTIFFSLPVPLEGIPLPIKNSARQLQQQLQASIKRDFEFKFEGKINPNLFSDCMQKLYNDLIEGKNVPHLGRFYIAAFLNAIGMPREQLMQMFAKTPNYSEKMTRYQIDRVVKQKLSPPSCAKIKEAGLCPNANCETKHPLSFYKKQLGIKTRTEKK